MPIKNKQQFKLAERSSSMLRVLFTGATGTGKTYTALELARLIAGDDADILVVDTEQVGEDAPRSAQYAPKFGHYVKPIPVLNIVNSPKTCYNLFYEAVEAALASGAEVVIIDSWTHENKFYLTQARATGDDKSYFKETKQKRDQLVTLIENANCHIIITQRAGEHAVFGYNAKYGKDTILRMALQPEGHNIGFSMNFNFAMEGETARVTKTVDGERIPQDEIYPVGDGDNTLYELLESSIHDGAKNKTVFKSELAQMGYPTDQWQALWKAIPQLGVYSPERHDEMLELIINYETTQSEPMPEPAPAGD